MSTIEITVTFKSVYTVDSADAIESYGTNNPDEMAAIDRSNFHEMPELMAETLLDDATLISVTAKEIA